MRKIVAAVRKKEDLQMDEESAESRLGEASIVTVIAVFLHGSAVLFRVCALRLGFQVAVPADLG